MNDCLETISRADAELAVAEAIRRAADAVRAVLTNSPTGEWGEEGISMSRAIERSILALAPAEALAEVQRLRAERDEALARVERLRHQITEASDPDFIWGAMDNVNDFDVSLDQFAEAASRAIRGAMQITGEAE